MVRLPGLRSRWLPGEHMQMLAVRQLELLQRALKVDWWRACGMHCWQTESCMVQGPRQSPIPSRPSRQGDRLASTISDPGERLSLIRVQTAKWSRIGLASHGGVVSV